MRYILILLAIAILLTRTVKAQEDSGFNFKWAGSYSESEPEAIHLDIPYLCQFCGLEVILDPYADLEKADKGKDQDEDDIIY